MKKSKADYKRCDIGECFFMDLQEITLQSFQQMQLISDLQREDLLLEFQKWANEFGKDYDADYKFDGDYYDRIDKFVADKIYQYEAEDFVWDESAVINLQYIMQYEGLSVDQSTSFEQWQREADLARRLAIEFTMHERLNHINYDKPNQADWETTIVSWLKQRNKSSRA